MKKYIFLLVLGLICSVSTVYASLYSIRNHDITAAAEQKLNENANFPQYARVKLLSDDDMHFDIKIVTPPSGSGSGHWIPDYDRKSCSSMGYNLTVNDCNPCTHVLEGRCPKNPNYYKHCNVNKKIFVSKCTGEGYSGGVTEGIVTTCKDSGGTSIFSVRDDSYQEYYEVCKCSPGYYWTAEGCVKCSCGTYKSSVSSLGEGAASCQTCPEGKYCPEASSTPLDCPYGSEGVGAGLCSADQCTKCGSCEYSNSDTSGKCQSCEPGSYPNSDNTDCVECPKGHACESGCLRKCDKGYYQDGIGSSSCKPCSAGQCCPITGLEEPGTCRAGYYCQYVTDDCNDIPCPEGNYCPAGRQNPTPCNPGTYSPNSGNSACLICKAGNYCGSTGMAAQTRCPEGYCCTKDGLKGLQGGIHCAADGSDCAIKCPAGHYCAFECENDDCTKKRGCTVPQACPAGTYSGEGAKVCTKCPEGKYCPNDGTVTPIDCPPGKYCPLGSSEPKGCPNGYYCPTNSVDPIICPRGSYCPAGSTSHILCPEGTYTDIEQQTKCTKCGPGSATNLAGAGATSCSYCPKGWYSTQETNVTCLQCGAGSATGLSREGANDCKECEPGYYSTEAANDKCFPCGRGKATGTELRAATTCTSCPAGTYSDAEANTFCKDCGKGNSTQGVNIEAQSCVPCEAGTYSTGTQNVTCLNCGPGKSTKSPFSGAENCSSCTQGTYSNLEKNTECLLCPEGQVPTADATGCTACAAGTYPKSDKTACLDCGLNSYCADGVKVSCPNNTMCFENGENATVDGSGNLLGRDPYNKCSQESECKCDLRNYIYPDPTNMMATNVCPGTLAGNICEDADGKYGTDCVCGGSNCAYGCSEYYTYPEKCTSSCKTCCDLSYRFKCEVGNNISGGSGISCGGFYTACSCNSGYEWNILTGQCEKTCTYEVTTAPDSCVSQYTSCVDSSVSPSVTRYKLMSCAAGCYANDSLNPTSCTLCEPGTYKNTDGNATSCAICEKGWICEGGNSHYQCEEKTCADQERSTVCKPCGEGVLACSATTCKASACETGYNLVDGVCVANACTGYTLTTAPSGSANYSSCIKSDKLTYYKIDSCKAGHKATVDSGVITSCTPCETGTYQPTETANTSCIDASVGCFVSTTGATQQTACNAGYYATTTKATNCSQVCGEGKYCSQKSTAPHCTETQECPENSTTLFDTSGSIGNCVCKAGYTLESGSCRPCPAGTYKNSVGNDVCLPCPTGSYSNTTGATSCSACPTGTGIYSCNPTDKTLICAGGYVLNNGVCTQCLEGYYCPQGSTSQLQCQEGYTSNKGSDDEGDCFSATCGSEYIFTSENCTSLCGSVCTSDGTDYYSCCATCPSDVTSCPAGQYLYTTTRPVNNTDFCKECRQCEDGKYCTGGTAQMQDCPANSTCSGTGNSNFTCNAGYYSDGTQCIATSAGCYSTAGATSQTSCSVGSYSTDASGRNEASDCEICGLNTYCKQSGSCTVKNTCPSNRITEATGATSISECICPANSYGANCTEGSCSECIACPENSGSELGSTTVYECGALPGYCFNSDTATTSPCPVGKYCSSGFLHGVLVGGDECDGVPSCPRGKTTEGEGNTSIDGCLADKGYYGAAGSGNATACPIGTYKSYVGSSTGTISDCTSCPLGYTTNSEASTSADQCLESACDANVYKYNSSNCTDGAVLGGDICQSGASKAYSSCSCPDGYSLTGWNPGTYGTTKGNVAGQTCMSTNTNACPCGSKCTGNSSMPEQCPASTYTPTTGASSCSTCPANSTSTLGTCGSCTCNLGYYYNSATNTCIRCPANSYCPAGATSPTACPVGKVSPEGSDNVSACTVKCGYYGNSGAGDATQCAVGYYCPEGASAQIKCPDGKTSVAGSCSDTACVDATCPEEFKYTDANCSNLSGTTCQAGSTVFYTTCTCADPSYSTNTTTCSAGSYLTSEGIVGDLSCNRCNSCPVNTYQPQTGFVGTSCTACPAGTTSTEGARALTDCKASAGTCLNTTTGLTETCPAGSYCIESSICPGTSCPVNKTSNSGTADVSGCYANAGYYGPAGEGDAQPCAIGYYCPLGSASGTQCPVNKTTLTTGADDVADCLAVPGYCGAADNTPGTACAKGTYKSTTENMSCECTTCPTNMTTRQTASTSVTQCVAVAGYYGPAGGPVTECGLGKYCPEASTAPNACPANKSTTSTTSGDVSLCCPAAGYYGTCGADDATICPAGTYKDFVGAAASCTACGENKTTSPGATSASDCYEAKCENPQYPYYYISDSDNNCSTDNLGGSYQQVAGTSIRCFAECKCSNSSSIYKQTKCSAGQKVSGTSTVWEGNPKQYCVSCASCDSGTYQSQTEHTSTTCDTCPANSTSKADRTGCEPLCGYYGNSFTPCTAGNFCEGGSSFPESCPAGYYCPEGTGKAGSGCAKEPLACNAGHYCPLGSAEQTKCPAGTYNPDTKQTSDAACRPCDANHYCPEGSSASLTCAAGQVPSDDQTSCVSSEEGTCAVPGQAAQTCPAGSYAASGSGECIACEPGYYSNPGMSYCYECGEKAYCPTGSAQTLCGKAISPTNRFECGSNLTTEGNTSTSSSDCVAVSGYCKNGSGNAETCPAGKYCAGLGSICSGAPACSAGYCCKTGVSVDQLEENLCKAGRYCPEGSSSCCNTADASSCNSNICPVGSYCPEGSGQATACPTNSTTTGTGSTDICACQCGAGYYMSYSDDYICQACPAGFACGAYSVENTLGTNSQGCSGGAIPTQCSSTNSYSCGTSSTCTQCPAGTRVATISRNIRSTGASTDLCIACEAGKISVAGSESCQDCPAGSYCPQNNAIDICGTAITGTQQVECPAGSYCPQGSAEPITCPAGHYCPAGSSEPSICSASTYRSETGGQSEADCLLCPAGHYCPADADGFYTSIVACTQGTYSSSSGQTDATACQECPAGSYCPADANGYYTSKEYCVAGTYNASTGQTSAEACVQCDAGKYNNSRGQSECQNCPAGQYSATAGSTSCDDCACGTSSIAGSASCTTCGSGEYSVAGGTCTTCTSNHYCHPGSCTQTPCPDHTTSGHGSSSLNSCWADAGYYWSSSAAEAPTLCEAGYYCEANGSRTTPGGNKVACPAGTYNDQEGQDDISDCKDCEPGHYCPEASAEQTACSTGKYNPEAGSTSSDACITCPADHYCPVSGTTAPTACPANTGTWDLKIPLGTTASAFFNPSIYPSGTSFQANTATPGAIITQKIAGRSAKYECVPNLGYYWKRGGTVAKCGVGSFFYSDNTCEGTDSMAFDLNPLYGGAEVVTKNFKQRGGIGQSHSRKYPVVGIMFNNTQALSVTLYAPVQSNGDSGVPLVTTAAQNNNVYIAARQGSWYGTVSYNLASTRDYPNAKSATEACSRLYASQPSNSSDAYAWMPYRWYVPSLTELKSITEAQARIIDQSLTDVETAYNENPIPSYYGYAPDSIMHVRLAGNVTTEVWTTTPNSSKQWAVAPILINLSGQSEEYVGGYQNIYRTLCVISIYKNCDASMSITSRSFKLDDTTPTGYCVSGLGAGQTNPQTGAFTTLLSGSTCLAGKCQNTSGTCQLCPAGKSCPSANTAQCSTMEDCAAGTYSATGATECSTCTAGYYCPGGTNRQICADGQYSSAGSSECSTCPAGYYCSGGTRTRCPAGSYCPAGSSSPTACATGYKSAAESDDASDCLACPTGFYCTNGIEYGCPVGTYNPSTGKSSESDCLSCPAGTYNSDIGMDYCTACPSGTYGTETGATSSDTCTKCPNGTHNSSLGASQCIPCPAGTVSGTIPGQHTCYYCQAGYYSEAGQTTCSVCPAGYYCPGRTDKQACPAGTYNQVTGQTSEDACYPCDQGNYCPVGSSDPSACPEGTYSCLGSSTCTECPAGSYQNLSESISCIYCPSGTYFDGRGATSVAACENCPAGYYCPTRTVASAYCGTSTVVTLKTACPKGTYSVGGAKTSCTSCPAGTYNDQTAQTSSAACKTCPAGTYSAEGASSCTPCLASTYSEAGSFICGVCPVGYYCPANADGLYDQKIACEPGTYNEQAGQTAATACLACPAGSYCPKTDNVYKSVVECPAGYSCPARSVEPTVCTIGTYQNLSGQTSCLPCVAGSYNSSNAATSCATCTVGYFCPGGQNRVACDPDTYNPSTGKSSKSDCLACPRASNINLDSPGYNISTTLGLTGMSKCKAPLGRYINGTELDFCGAGHFVYYDNISGYTPSGKSELYCGPYDSTKKDKIIGILASGESDPKSMMMIAMVDGSKAWASSSLGSSEYPTEVTSSQLLTNKDGYSNTYNSGLEWATKGDTAKYCREYSSNAGGLIKWFVPSGWHFSSWLKSTRTTISTSRTTAGKTAISTSDPYWTANTYDKGGTLEAARGWVYLFGSTANSGSADYFQRSKTKKVMCLAALVPQCTSTPQKSFFDVHSGACRTLSTTCRTSTVAINDETYGSGHYSCECTSSTKLTAPTLQSGTRSCSSSGKWTY